MLKTMKNQMLPERREGCRCKGKTPKTFMYVQYGFVKGGNILDNLFILRECVEETYRKKEQMVAIEIDLKKHMTQ